MNDDHLELVKNPLKFISLIWPDFKIYDKQAEILLSLRDNDITCVRAGNMLGKDFIAAMGTLWFFCSRQPAKIVTSSVDYSQLNTVLWGEMRRLVSQAKYPLPIEMNQMEAYQLDRNGARVPLGTMIGRVVKKNEGMLGQHVAITADGRANDGVPRTLMVIDEASGFSDQAYNDALTWAHRVLIIGNPFPCENFFRKLSKEGDVKRMNGVGYRIKTMRIRAEDSPSVAIPLKAEQEGKTVKNQRIIPGLIWLDEYRERRRLWDPIRQCVSLDGEFYEGGEVLLYPPDWLNNAEKVAEFVETSGLRKRRLTRKPVYMGVDTGEGGDDTCWVIADRYGVIDVIYLQTPDTSVIANRTIGLMNQYGIKPRNVTFDRGGGGKQIADWLRARKFKVRTVGFGESATDPEAYKRHHTSIKPDEERLDTEEERYVYKNRRAEMYCLLSFNLLDPINEMGFGIPAKFHELRRQLSVMPKLYDSEGRLYLPPKDKPSPNYQGATLRQLLGRSPDHADALVLCTFGMLRPALQRVAGVLF